jgi:Toprim domain
LSFQHPNAAEVASHLSGVPFGEGYLCRCPVLGHGKGRGDHTRSLLFRDGDQSGRLLVKCFAGCPPTSILAVIRSISKLEHRQHTRAPSSQRLATSERKSTEERTRQAEVIWSRSRELGATLATTYLNKHRGLDLKGLDLSHCLRWDDARQCIVGKMTDPLTGVMTGVHRTFLDCEGRKLRRAMLGRKGVVRLTPDEEVTYGLAITEGIEDALSVILGGAGPAWSACDAGGVERFPILAGIDVVTIFADRDPRGTGEVAARACARRWLEAGKEARLWLPSAEKAL